MLRGKEPRLPLVYTSVAFWTCSFVPSFWEDAAATILRLCGLELPTLLALSPLDDDAADPGREDEDGASVGLACCGLELDDEGLDVVTASLSVVRSSALRALRPS